MRLLIGTYQDQTKKPLVGALETSNSTTSKNYLKKKLLEGDTEPPFTWYEVEV